jgi:hypothetical protein
MMSDSITIEYITHFGDGVCGPYSVARGTTLREFLRQEGLESKPNIFVTINRVPVGETTSSPTVFEESLPVSMSYSLREGDRVCVTPRNVGGAWLPRLKDFERYLGSRGFRFLRNGKGDHEVWENQGGQKISVNPLSSNKHEVDMACLRALARLLGTSYGAVVEDIHRFLKDKRGRESE